MKSATFVNARVITGDGRECDSASVEIESGCISRVETNAGSRKDSATIDLEHRTLMPGLIDTHTHLVGGNKVSGESSVDSLKLSDPLIKAVFDSVEAARVTVEAGITTVREVGCRDYIDVYLRRAQAAGQITAPRMFASGPGFAIIGGHGSYFDPDRAVSGPHDVTRRIRELVANGIDVLKLRVDGPEFSGDWLTLQLTSDEVETAIAETRRLGRRVASHANSPEAIDMAVRAGTHTVEHGWYLSEENCRLLLERSVPLVPTLSVLVSINRRGPALCVPALALQFDEPGIFERIAMAIELGVTIAMGSDTGGIVTHLVGAGAEELIHYVKCGMTPMQAIMSATLNAAEALGAGEELGTIEVGKLADLILVDADPLERIEALTSDIVGVIQGGEVIRDDLGLLRGLGVAKAPAAAAAGGR